MLFESFGTGSEGSVLHLLQACPLHRTRARPCGKRGTQSRRRHSGQPPAASAPSGSLPWGGQRAACSLGCGEAGAANDSSGSAVVRCKQSRGHVSFSCCAYHPGVGVIAQQFPQPSAYTRPAREKRQTRACLVEGPCAGFGRGPSWDSPFGSPPFSGRAYR